MASFDIDYDQNLGNPATGECPLSFAKDENFYVATENALPWEAPAVGGINRAIVAISWIEALVRKAPVKDPMKLSTIPLLSSCLHLDCLCGALECLVDLGLITTDDGDDSSVRDFGSLDELQREVDAIIAANPDEARLQVDDTKWDEFDAVNEGDAWEWLEGVSLEQLTTAEGNLHVYSELSLALGPRPLDATRRLPASQFHVMV